MTAKQMVIETQLSAVRSLRLVEDPDLRIEAAQREKQLADELKALAGEEKADGEEVGS